MNDTKMRYFLCLSNTLNFTEAAKKLFISQQALSKTISRMEEEIGTKLFERKYNGLQLTETGMRCHKILTDFSVRWDYFLTSLQNNKQLFSLRLGFHILFEISSEIFKAIETVSNKMPNLTIEVENDFSNILFDRLMENKLDMIVVYDQHLPHNKQVNKLIISNTPMMFWIAASSSFPEKKYSHPYDFKGLPYLNSPFAQETPQDTLARANRCIKRYGLSPTEIVILPNNASVYANIELGHGFTVAPSKNNIACYRKGLRAVYTGMDMPLVCAWRTNDERSSELRQYALHLQEAYASTVSLA